MARRTCFDSISAAPTGRGGLDIAPADSGIASKTSAQAGSITSSRNAMWAGNMRIGPPTTSGTSARPAIGKWTAIRYPATRRKLSERRRPSRTASTRAPKSSSARIKSDASRATSVPRCPMATPTSAALSAGASLTPSPVIATTEPSARNACTIRSLCAGFARAITRVVVSNLANSPSSRQSIVAPMISPSVKSVPSVPSTVGARPAPASRPA